MVASFVARFRRALGKTRHPSAITLSRMPDDDELYEELEEDEAELDEQELNAHTLSIRRADGEEVVSIFSPAEEWSVYLQPGGGIRNAFVGTPSDPTVWVDANDQEVLRDDDGTYVIRIG
jgi:hypothetical protein